MATRQHIMYRDVPSIQPLVTDRVRSLTAMVSAFSPILLLYVVYTLIRWALADRGPVFGAKNATSLLNIETATHLDWEHGIQSYGLHHDWLVRAANWYYVAGFLPVLIAAAVLAAWRAPAAFSRIRNVFAVSLCLALAGFAFFPVAPPRLLGIDHGFTDTLMTYGPRYYGDAHGSSLFNGFGRLPSMVNVYAAMPSMHVAWSAVAGAMLAVVIARRWAWSLAVIHPLLMALTVVVTGNHYVLDVIGGLIALGLAIVAVKAWSALQSAQVQVQPAQPRQRLCGASCGD